MANVVSGGLNYYLQMKSAQFEAGAAKANRSLKTMSKQTETLTTKLSGLSKGFIAAAGVGGLGAMIASSFKSLDALAKMSKRLNVSSEELSKLQFAGEQSGISLDAMNKILQDFQKRLGETALGTGEAQKAFKELGIDARRLAQLSPIDAFRQMVSALDNVEDAYQKNALAQKIFGEQGVAVLQATDNLTTNFAELGKQAERAGRVYSKEFLAKIEESNDAMNVLKTGVVGVAGQLSGALSPAIKTVAETMSGLIEHGVALAKNINELSGGWAGWIIQTGAVVGALTLLFTGMTKGLKISTAWIAGLFEQSAAYNANTAAVEANSAAKARNAVATATATVAGVAGATGVGASNQLLLPFPDPKFRRLEARKDQLIANANTRNAFQGVTATSPNLIGDDYSGFTKQLTPMDMSYFKSTSGAIEKLQGAWQKTSTFIVTGVRSILSSLRGLANGLNGIVIAGLAATEAINQFYLISQSPGEWGDALWGEGTIGFKFGEAFSNWWNKGEIKRATEDWQEHLNTINKLEEADKKQAAAAAKLAAARAAAAKEVEESNKRFLTIAEQVNARIQAARGQSDRDRLIEEAKRNAKTFEEAQRAVAEINRGFDAADKIEKQRTRIEDLTSSVRSFSDQSKNLGKTESDILLARLTEARDLAKQVNDTYETGILNGLIATFQGASIATAEFNKHQKGLNDAVAKLIESREIRAALNAPTDFRPGAFQAGSVEAYNQRQQVDTAQRQMLQQQKEQLALEKEVRDLMKENNITTKELLRAFVEAGGLN